MAISWQNGQINGKSVFLFFFLSFCVSDILLRTVTFVLVGDSLILRRPVFLFFNFGLFLTCILCSALNHLHESQVYSFFSGKCEIYFEPQNDRKNCSIFVTVLFVPTCFFDILLQCTAHRQQKKFLWFSIVNNFVVACPSTSCANHCFILNRKNVCFVEFGVMRMNENQMQNDFF